LRYSYENDHIIPEGYIEVQVFDKIFLRNTKEGKAMICIVKIFLKSFSYRTMFNWYSVTQVARWLRHNIAILIVRKYVSSSKSLTLTDLVISVVSVTRENKYVISNDKTSLNCRGMHFVLWEPVFCTCKICFKHILPRRYYWQIISDIFHMIRSISRLKSVNGLIEHG